jgi:acyl-coenzyme A thioesterase 13
MKSHLTLLSATSTGSTEFSFKVVPEFCNRAGTLHGGAQAMIFDICTTTALAPLARDGFWQFVGVTRNLNISYLRPIPVGTNVVVVSDVVVAGKRLATIRAEIRDMNGKVLSTAEHLKATIDPVAVKL